MKSKSFRSVRISQLVKCLPCKHQEIPRSHERKKEGKTDRKERRHKGKERIRAHSIREQTGGALELAGWPA